MKIKASGPITSWQVDGETMGTVTDFISWGSKITADGDCSHEIKRRLLLGRKAMTNLDSILKSRAIILPTKVHLVKDIVFLVVMYGCETWTIKKAEHQRIDALELWCWRRLLRVPGTARKSNQSILKKICPACSLEGLMLKLKLQCFGYLMWRTDSFEKTLMLGKIEARRRRGQQRMRWLDGITNSKDMSWWWVGRPGVLQSMGSQRVRHNWVTELNWTESIYICSYLVSQFVHLILPWLILGKASHVQSCWALSLPFLCLNKNSFCLICIEHHKCNNKPKPERTAHVSTHTLSLLS